MCQFCDIAVNMTGSKVVRDREFVKTMMANGVNTKDCNGWTPLHHAIVKNLPEMVEKLIRNGADLKIKSRVLSISPWSDGQSALDVAIILQIYQMVELLLKSCSISELKSSLSYANIGVRMMAFNNDIKMGKLLLDHGIGVHDDLVTLAIMGDLQEWVKLFIQYGFEVDKVMDTYRRTGLQVALEVGRTKAAETFIQHGASLSIRNSNGDTAFEQTCKLMIAEKKIPMMEMFKHIVYFQ